MKLGNKKFWVMVFCFLLALFVIAGGVVFAFYYTDAQRIDNENERLDNVLDEINAAFEEGNYALAKAKIASLVFNGSNTANGKKAAKKWSKTKEELLSLVAVELGDPIKDINQGSSTTSTKPQNPTKKPTVKPEDFDAEVVAESLVVTEYRLSNYSETLFVIIENPTQFDLSISASLKIYNSANKLVGAKEGSEPAVQSGSKTIMVFSIDEEYDRVEYNFSVEEEDYYTCVVSALTYETVSAKNKEIMSVTNTGDISAEFVEAYVLFFDEGKVVDYDWTYFTDDDSEIKPGKTITREMDTYEEYDSVEVYFTGRGYN